MSAVYIDLTVDPPTSDDETIVMELDNDNDPLGLFHDMDPWFYGNETSDDDATIRLEDSDQWHNPPGGAQLHIEATVARAIAMANAAVAGMDSILERYDMEIQPAKRRRKSTRTRRPTGACVRCLQTSDKWEAKFAARTFQ